jgi:hypothetical protein
MGRWSYRRCSRGSSHRGWMVPLCVRGHFAVDHQPSTRFSAAFLGRPTSGLSLWPEIEEHRARVAARRRSCCCGARRMKSSRPCPNPSGAAPGMAGVIPGLVDKSCLPAGDFLQRPPNNRPPRRPHLALAQDARTCAAWGYPDAVSLPARAVDLNGPWRERRRGGTNRRLR